MPHNMETVVHPEERGWVLVAVTGTMDSTTAPRLLSTCRELKDDQNSVILDLSGVDFIASSGVGSLLAMAEEFRGAGVGIRFAALSTAVSSVIQLLNLNRFLEIFPTTEEARTAEAA
ncbi:MAG: STAS domain-containing protein [Candidatus Eisenbacteria bacterium]|uniref:Anti-sigma factor antagonist n=1 Tax=Eiseniibacteriota bacterium TaxID=2212470 RepID=A0A7Y2EB03_UNCEI|nr:STAS domain-containing protein [Candidatus Eisenbacteria bacterium]